MYIIPSSSAAIGETKTPELPLPVGEPLSVTDGRQRGAPAAGDPEIPPAACAIDLILAERARHFELGHDLQADLALLASDKPGQMLDRAKRYADYAREDVHFRKPAWRTHAARHAAQSAALLVAFIDALAAHEGEGEAA